MSQTYTPILPATASAHPDGAASTATATLSVTSTASQAGPSGPSSTSRDLIKRKRVGTKVACSHCRIKKTRCNGKQPCNVCQRRGADCVYTQDRTDEAADAIQLLKSMPEGQAIELLRRLRDKVKVSPGTMASASSPPTSSSTSANTPAQRRPSLSSHQSPSYGSTLERELSSRNPTSYPALSPIPSAELAGSSLLRTAKTVGPRTPAQQELPGPRDPDRHRDKRPAGAEHVSGVGPPTGRLALDGLSDGKMHTFCDERLQHLEIDFWTEVQISNDFAAQVISLYLETDHPLLAIFDPDLFLHDLVNKEDKFCSRFLVHALLYWACLMFSAFDDKAKDLADRFCAEATDMWELENDSDTLLNVAGAVLLSLSYLGHGKDHVVLEYTTQAALMAMRMGLCGLDEAPGSQGFENIPRDDQNAVRYTAWGIFNWTVFVALFYRQPGSQFPKHPPGLPPPGIILDSCTGASSDWDWRHQELHSPQYMGKTFPALCEFWKIVHDVTLLYYPNEHSKAPKDFESEFAEFKFRELLAWGENLPPELVRSNDSPHHVLVFHMFFHCSVMDIFRPFIQGERSRLRTFSAPGSTPYAAFQASVNQLKHLIFGFRANYETSTYTILWQTALVYLVNALLKDTNDPEWQNYFLLCIHSYGSLRRPYRIAEVIVQGLLSMSLREGDISGDDARQLLRELQDQGGDQVTDQGKGNIRATFMGDLDLAMKDMDAANMENLAAQFEDMALFQEFIINWPDGAVQDGG